MPCKGYKKPNAKSEIVKFRVDVTQRKAYEITAEAAGYRDVSSWARALLNAAAGIADN